jgi:hypothetical protein
MRELCGEYPDRAGWPTGGSVPVKAPDGGSEFSPGSTDSESVTDSSESGDSDSPDPEMRDSEPSEAKSEDSEPSEAESEDSGSSEAESEDSAPFDVEASRKGPLMSDSSSSDSSSSSESEEWDSSSTDSGFAKLSSSDTEGEITPSAPLLDLEEIEDIGRVVAGLSGRAMRQVRKLLTMLAQMRKDLSPSARIEAVRELGWRLGSSREAREAGEDNHGPKPMQLSGEDGRLMKYLEDWQRICEDGEERRGAAREEVNTPDNSLACAEEWLAARRAAELQERVKVIERLLPVIAAQLGILWSEAGLCRQKYS